MSGCLSEECGSDTWTRPEIARIGQTIIKPIRRRPNEQTNLPGLHHSRLASDIQYCEENGYIGINILNDDTEDVPDDDDDGGDDDAMSILVYNPPVLIPEPVC